MKVFSLVVMILGCFLGAGFVSGREIASYFSKYGSVSNWGILFTGILFFLLLYLFLKLSDRVNSFSGFVSFYFGRLRVVVVWLFSICIFILISSMIAGTFSLSKSMELSSIILVVVTLCCAFFTVIGSYKSITNINLILVPLILFVVIGVCGINCFKITLSGSLLNTVVSSTNYVLINIVTLGLFVIEIGGRYSAKQKLMSAIISSLIITIFMLIINNAIINNNLELSELPILDLAGGGALSILTAIVIWGGLFTTIISCLYILSNLVNEYIQNYKLTVLLILLSALAVSRIGFEIIVGYLYSIIGLVGLVFMLFITKKEREIYIIKISRKY